MAPIPSKLPQFITLTIRLDRSNYVYWRSQVLATVRAHGFESVLLTTSSTIPDSTLIDGITGATVANPEFQTWQRKDQFLMSWMFSSISESMLGHVSRCSHSFEIWQILEDLYRSQSKAQIMNLKFKLQTLKKGDLSIDEYTLQLRSIGDAITAAGHLISDDDLVMYLLSGLGPEFDAVVVNLTTRQDSLLLSEIRVELGIEKCPL